jgi:hypothetical protein
MQQNDERTERVSHTVENPRITVIVTHSDVVEIRVDDMVSLVQHRTCSLGGYEIETRAHHLDIAACLGYSFVGFQRLVHEVVVRPFGQEPILLANVPGVDTGTDGGSEMNCSEGVRLTSSEDIKTAFISLDDDGPALDLVEIRRYA